MRSMNSNTMPMSRCIAAGLLAAAMTLAVAPTAAAMQYEYDSLNRLAKVIYDDGKVVMYTYDAVGNRMSKKVFTPVAADFDLDADADLADFLIFQMCFNGPNRPAASGCSTDADLDGDVDVDLADFLEFQRCFNGPNRTPKCE